MLGKLSIIGAVAAILMIPTALSAQSDPCISADRARRFNSILIVVCFGGHALGLYSESMLLADANK